MAMTGVGSDNPDKKRKGLDGQGLLELDMTFTAEDIRRARSADAAPRSAVRPSDGPDA